MKTRRFLKQLLYIGVPLALLVAGVYFWRLEHERPYRELRAAVHKLQLQIERFAVDNQGSYPPDLETLLRVEKIRLPDNPFRDGKLKILKPEEPWEPGGIVYVGWGPIVAIGDPLEPNPILPTDTDMYIL